LDTFSGSIKAYATISDTRLPLVPDIPTFGEIGLPALSYSQWFGFFAPKETPRDIVGELNAGRGGPGDPLSTTNSGLLRRGCDHGAVGQDYAC
jgi:hypothetical protein